MKTVKSFEVTRSMFYKVGIEIVIDDYEVIVLDCHGSYEEASADSTNDKEMENLYKWAMKIYSERIDEVKEKTRVAMLPENNKNLASLIDWAAKKEKEEGE